MTIPAPLVLMPLLVPPASEEPSLTLKTANVNPVMTDVLLAPNTISASLVNLVTYLLTTNNTEFV